MIFSAGRKGDLLPTTACKALGSVDWIVQAAPEQGETRAGHCLLNTRQHGLQLQHDQLRINERGLPGTHPGIFLPLMKGKPQISPPAELLPSFIQLLTSTAHISGLDASATSLLFPSPWCHQLSPSPIGCQAADNNTTNSTRRAGIGKSFVSKQEVHRNLSEQREGGSLKNVMLSLTAP